MPLKHIYQKLLPEPKNSHVKPEYQSLPVELKIMIWTLIFAQWSSGAHRFRLTRDPANKTRLVLDSDDVQKKDASAWRERRSLMRIDGCSYFSYPMMRVGAISLYRDMSKKFLGGMKDNGPVMVCPSTDLVTFRFNYNQEFLKSLSRDIHRKVFAGIETIGVEIEFLTRGYTSTKTYMPFAYRMHNSELARLDMITFIECFPDLKAFYLICPLTQDYIHKSIQELPLGTRKLAPLEPASHKHSMPPLSIRLFRHLQGQS